MGIAQDKEIDKFALDEECAKQHPLCYKYSVMMADAEQKYDLAKNTHAILEADMALAMRKKGTTPDGVKATNDAVKEAVVGSPKVIKSFKKLAEAQHEIKLIRAAISALDTKRSMLGHMVKLLQMHYYEAGGTGGRQDPTEHLSDNMMKHLNREKQGEDDGEE